MSGAIQFETPENVRVEYLPAGLGTRFVAWLVDQIFVTMLVIVIAVLLVFVGMSMTHVFDDLDGLIETKDPEAIGKYVIGLSVVVMGLGSFAYFTLTELFWRGQSVGKRLCKIRVVKVDGFALDPASILLRNIFRVLDNLPLLWVVPVMSKRSQRTGDMVSGTVVISDEAPDLSGVRVQLSERKVVEAEFRFDSRSLQRLTTSDFEALERLLERLPELKVDQRDALVEKFTNSLAAKLQIETPLADHRQRFLEDLLAAELRRQSRLLA